MSLQRAASATYFTKLFGCTKPFVGGPMAGFTSDELVIETCNAGGIGSIGKVSTHFYLTFRYK